jgi:hypothetical protein
MILYETAAAFWPICRRDPRCHLRHGRRRSAARRGDFLYRGSRHDRRGADVKRPPPSGNCRHRFFVDLITLYDAKDKTVAERRAIAGMTRGVIEKARGVEGLAVDFSGAHSQLDDPGSAVSAAIIFGSESMASMVCEQKKLVDPGNRFRFHPYAKFL